MNECQSVGAALAPTVMAESIKEVASSAGRPAILSSRSARLRMGYCYLTCVSGKNIVE